MIISLLWTFVGELTFTLRKQMHLVPSLVQDSKDDYIKGTELLEEEF